MKKCNNCFKSIKSGDPEWYLYQRGEIMTYCSSRCHAIARAVVAPPAPKPEPRDPRQQEAFNEG